MAFARRVLGRVFGSRHASSTVRARLEALRTECEARSASHLGYPYNLRLSGANADLHPFLGFFMNNLGDAYAQSNYGVNTYTLEREVVETFASMWGGGSTDVWGAVTSCGTEGNLLGILYGREAIRSTGAAATLVSSVESHYSVAKAGRMYDMPYERVRSTCDGAIDYDALERAARRIVHAEGRGVCVVVNAGSTMRGAHDQLDRVVQALDAANVPPERRYLHCDAALSGVILPVLPEASAYHFGFDRGADSIAVSGHKQLGTPVPCGVVCTRREHMERWAAGTPAEADYVNTQDSTLGGSRSGFAALALWYALEMLGREGLARDARQCLAAAGELTSLLASHAPRSGATRARFSTTVVFRRPSDALVQKYQLATSGAFAHIVCTPSVGLELLHAFVDDYVADEDA